MIRAWEGAADQDRNGQVTLEEMESFVRRETKTHARDALSTIQTPVFRVDRVEAANWVVASVASQRVSRARRSSPAASFLRPSATIPRRSRSTPRTTPPSWAGRSPRGPAATSRPPSRDYEQATRINPYLTVAFVGQGAILTQLNRPDEAIEACSRAIALDGKNARAYFNRGVAREARRMIGSEPPRTSRRPPSSILA